MITGARDIIHLDELEGSLFAPFDVVALERPWPEGALDAGLWGTVLAACEGGRYEVEFTDRDGHVLQVAVVPEELLRLVWADPEA
jgi:hypothetical protein